MMWGAKVKTPVGMRDDVLEDAIVTVIKEMSSRESNSSPGVSLNTASRTENSINNSSGNGDLAVIRRVKEHMDETWSPSWHVVIGRNFGSMVTHETKSFLYFYYNSKAVMLYKAG